MNKTINRGDHAETLMQILLTIIEKTPDGGATREDLLKVYEKIKDFRPTARTIQRDIEKLNSIFNPDLKKETKELGEETESISCEDESVETWRAISREPGRNPVYKFKGGEKGQKNATKNLPDYETESLTLLGRYPELRNLMKQKISGGIQSILRESLSGLTNEFAVINEIEKHVYVADPLPIDIEINNFLISRILQGIRQKECVKFEYLRSADGVLVGKAVEPRGLVHRMDNWYLVGEDCQKKEMRVYLLSNIRSLEIIEGAHFTLPAGFNLQNMFKTSWSIWTSEDNAQPEKITLEISAGYAERFRTTKYHPTQVNNELPKGALEVQFTLSKAEAMTPWLMSWGGTIKVKNPKWLRERLIKDLKAAALCHENSGKEDVKKC